MEKLGTLLAAAGIWGPLAFILIYAVGVCLFIPGTLLTALGAAIFGPYWGFVYVWVAAMLGAAGAFLIGRYLGREFAASLIGDRLKKYDEAVERNGFATVLYLRLVYFPFTAMNFGMGLTRVRYRDYLWGTGLGHFGGNLHLHLLRGHRQGGLGHRPVGQPPHLEGLLFSGALYFLPVHPKNYRKIEGVANLGGKLRRAKFELSNARQSPRHKPGRRFAWVNPPAAINRNGR